MNVEKSKVMVYGDGTVCDVEIQAEQMEQMNELKYLGMYDE